MGGWRLLAWVEVACLVIICGAPGDTPTLDRTIRRWLGSGSSLSFSLAVLLPAPPFPALPSLVTPPPPCPPPVIPT